MKYKTDFPISFLKQYQLLDTTEFVHDTFDILLVLAGQVSITFASGEMICYGEHSLTTLHGGHSHKLAPSRNCFLMHMGLSPAFVEKYIGPDQVIFCDSVLEPNRNYLELKKLLSQISLLYLDYSELHELSIYSLIFQFMDRLKKHFRISLPLETQSGGSKYQQRMTEIREYINLNYSQPVTLSSMAEHMHLTPQYLSRFFKKYFHINFNEYLNMVRIQHATRELRYSDLSVTDIALRQGFPNIATFHKHFREIHGISPRSYREQYPAPKELGYEEPQPNERNVFLFPDKPESERNVSVSVQNKTTFSRNFSKLINIGFAKNLLVTRFQEQFLNAREELHFSHVRLEGLVSNSLIPRLASDHQYYFTVVGDILDFLQQQDLIPVIELGKNSYDYLAASSSGWDFRGYGNNAKFHAMLDAFLEFVTTRYNPDWYGQWMFELWKSPGEPLKSYIAGYRTIAQIIRKYIPKALFGGPGYNTGYPPDGLTECLLAFRDLGLSPDFISVHFFSIQSIKSAGNTKLVLPPDEYALCTRQKWILAQIEKILGPDCPLYITEFNFSLLPDCFVSTSCYQAAFLCMNLLELHESSDMIGYRVLSDMGFNILAPDRFSSFSIGLINNNGIKMPSYHAYKLLNKLGDHLIERNENYCVTCTDENHYQVLAYHYVHFSDFLFLQEKEMNTLRKVYSPFKKSPAFQMTIRLTDLQPGVYRVKRNLLDRFHGSLIDIKLGELLNGTIDDETFLYKTLTLSPQEKTYLTAACVPEERIIYQNIRDELVLTTPLYPHNVCLWEVVKEY